MSSRPMIVGLTGQTGAGKSTVSKIFVRKGFELIDADRVSREVVALGKPCLEELFAFFGHTIRNPDGTLNRRMLAKLVFTDQKKLEKLNSICHPYIMEEIQSRIAHYAESGKHLVLLDAPTLFESGASDLCDVIVSVLAEPERRCQRIMERDGLTVEAAHERMNAQHDEDFFISHSDFLLRNNADLAQLSSLAEEIADKIGALYEN